MIEAIWYNLLKLSPWLLAGTAFAALLHVLLPKGFASRQLTGASGVLRAVAFGVPLPLCSCGVIPAGIGLKQEGASDGAAMGFLISTPQTGVDSILVSASFLGWPFTLLKVLAAGVTGIIGGWLVDRSGNSTASGADSEAPHSAGGEACCESDGKLRQAISYGLNLIRSIWGWLVAGIVISAAISVFLPTSKMGWVSDLGVTAASVAVLIISAPLYVCATASVPIAGALVDSGFPVGAALVFLMAGPATNVTTMGAVYRHFGAKSLAIYLGTIIIGSIAFGIAFDALIEPSAKTAASCAEHAGTWWEIGSASALLLLLGYFAGEATYSRFRKTGGKSEVSEDCCSHA